MADESPAPHAVVHKQMQDVILALKAENEELRKSVAEKEDWVDRKDFECIMHQLEDERIQHAQTKAWLMDAQDKLDFAQGQIEVLNKQLQREKKQFEQTFGAVRNRALVQTVKNVALEAKCHELERMNESQDDALSAWEVEIDSLQEKLKKQSSSFKQQLMEADLQKQQEQYIASVMEEKDKKLSSTQQKGHFRDKPQKHQNSKLDKR